MSAVQPALQAQEDLDSTSRNPFRIALLDDPYPAYAALRQRSPVHWVAGCRGRDWILTRYEDVRRVLMDPRCGADDLAERVRQTALASHRTDDLRTLQLALSHWLFFVQGDTHSKLHSALQGRFTPGAVAGRRASIRRHAKKLLRALIDTGEADLIADFAAPLPLLVGAALLGAEPPDLDRFRTIAQDLFSVFTVPTPLRRYRRINAQARTLIDWLNEVFRTKRSLPSDDLASDLVRQVDAGELTEQAALSLAAMVLSVGQDTTQHLLGNSLAALLDHPAERERLLADPSLMPRAIKELARFNTPVQVVVHIATAPIEISGHHIKAGERIHFYLGAAHRDPAQFEQPDTLNLLRAKPSRLLFGAGPHFCLGAHLAQLTAEEGVAAALSAAPDLRLAPGARKRWIKSLHMRGLAALPVVRA